MSTDEPRPGEEIREDTIEKAPEAAQEDQKELKEQKDQEEQLDPQEEAGRLARRRRLLRWLAAFVALDVIVGAALGASIWRDRQEAERAREEAARDVGVTQEMTEAQRQTQIDLAIGEAHRHVQITSEVTVSGTQAQMIVSNTEENACAVSVVLLLIRDGQTEEIGRTDLILPGWHVRSVTLSRALPPGEHRALARMLFYTTEGNAFLGSTARQVLLRAE